MVDPKKEAVEKSIDWAEEQEHYQREHMPKKLAEDMAKDRAKETAVQSAVRTSPNYFFSPSLLIPVILLVAVATTVILNQAGLITLPHFGNANSVFNASEFPEPAVIGTPWNYNFNHQLIPVLDPEGNKGPYTFYLGSGIGFPPMGLILGPDGILRGTPTGTGGNFQVCAKDIGGRSTCRTYHLNVVPANSNSGSGAGSGSVKCPATSCEAGHCCSSKGVWDPSLGTYVKSNEFAINGNCNCPRDSFFMEMVSTTKVCGCLK